MKLLPSLRQKKRYIVFEVMAEEKFSREEIKEAVDKGLLLFLGQLGLARAGLMWIKGKFNQKKQRFMLKVNHKHVSEVRAGVSLIKKIKNTSIIIRSLIVSGTIKKASEALDK